MRNAAERDVLGTLEALGVEEIEERLEIVVLAPAAASGPDTHICCVRPKCWHDPTPYDPVPFPPRTGGV